MVLIAVGKLPAEPLCSQLKERWQLLLVEGYNDEASVNESSVSGVTEDGIQKIACIGGRGRQLRAAFRYAFGQMGAAGVITLPAAGKCALADIEAVEKALKAGAMIAVNDLKESSPLILGWAFKKLTAFTAGLKIAPWASLRGYSAECADFILSVKGERAEYEVSLLQAAVTEKLPVVQLTGTPIEKQVKGFSLKTTVLAGLGILNYAPSLKFMLSSLIAFFIDSVLLMMIAPLLPWRSDQNDVVAKTISWLVSSQVNFTINQKLVFRAKGGTWKAMGQYYSLAAVVYLGKVGLLYLLRAKLHLRYLLLANIICEMSLFVLNYFVQKKLIFRRKSEKSQTKRNS